ncbi:hypothetical protein [Magnetospirillum molischianum]|uniref:Uncharacterized protein n=1 Tax=Magnetospirillum molischianum DSM 120 TaxID=1150626 RepID=H8FSK1_MAGML|nr:hypothetical protein [Magnetospirillum molischianum]CCG41339.1 conserved exported hypothetical protein [Magnetospirillum molischianum DSM 120]
MRNLWLRGKFHLSALVILVPLPFLPAYFADKPLPHVAEIHRQVVAGPFSLGLVTEDQPPDRGAWGERIKEYTVTFRPGDMDTIRGVFLRVGKPRSLRTLGALAEGGAYEQHADVMLPDELSGSEDLWLTVETWNGTLHQAVVPLREILGGSGK